MFSKKCNVKIYSILLIVFFCCVYCLQVKKTQCLRTTYGSIQPNMVKSTTVMMTRYLKYYFTSTSIHFRERRKPCNMSANSAHRVFNVLSAWHNNSVLSICTLRRLLWKWVTQDWLRSKNVVYRTCYVTLVTPTFDLSRKEHKRLDW